MKQTAAKIISYSLDTSLMWPFFVLLLLLGTDLTESQMQMLFFPLFVFELFLPVALLGYFHRIGKISDWEMTDVKERRLYFSIVLIFHIVSLVCLFLWGTTLAWEIRLAALLIEIIGTAVTFFWKVSIHLASYTMMALICNVLFGWQWWWLFLLIPILMWARVARKKHTIMQTVVGAGCTTLLMLLFLWIFSIPVT